MSEPRKRRPSKPLLLDDGYRLPDDLWARMEPLLLPRPPHPLGCHNPRTPDRKAMDAILFVLRTGCQWNALSATGICSSSSAHRRFQDWTRAGVVETIWREGLLAYDALVGIDWRWPSLDGAMGKAPLGGKKGPNPNDRGKRGGKRSVLTDGRGVPMGVVIVGANVNDPLLMAEALDAVPIARPKPTPRTPQHLCLDKGYDYAAYHHPMVDAAAIVEWVRATGLRPFLDPLGPEDTAGFLTAYATAIDAAYPPRAGGRRLLAFPRVFIVARRAA